MAVEFQHQGPRRFASLTQGAVLLLWACAATTACERPVPVSSGSEPGARVTLTPQPMSAAGIVAFAVPSDSAEPEGKGSLEAIGAESSGVSVRSLADGTSGGNDALQALPDPNYLAAVVPEANGGKVLSAQFADLLPGACRAELRRRKIVVRPANFPAQGVASPLRLGGTVGPLRFVTPGIKSVYGILDCRLVLLLSELAPTLATLSVKEVYVDNFYRPKAHLPGKRKTPSQHAFGLAVDIAGFKMADGTVLNVERDFGGSVGAPVCGPDAVLFEGTRETVLLRNIVCEIARLGAFNYLLTPNHDTAHHNHLHGDIKRKTRDHVLR